MSAPSVHVEVIVIRKTPVPDVVTEDRITDLVNFCLVEEGASGPWQVAIAFVDEGEIGLLHDQFREIPRRLTSSPSRTRTLIFQAGISRSAYQSPPAMLTNKATP